MIKQKTVKKDFSLDGIGLHTGEKARITVKPAPVDSGLCFKRVDIAGSPEWKVCADQIQTGNTAGRCTIIGKEDAAVQTIEHVTAALFGMGVDNALIEIDGPEVPGMDGSAMPFANAIVTAGIEDQEVERRYITLKAPVSLSRGNASISIFPSDDFKITYVLDYAQEGLGPQVFNFELNEGSFVKEVAPARTFCLRKEAEDLKAAGFGKGADTTNTLVMELSEPLDNILRFDDECARHKVVDLIGDLSFLGRYVRGHVFAVRSGHYLNACLVKAVYDQNKEQRFPSAFSDRKSGAAAVDINGVMGALPHRYPFLLVDRIIEIDPGKRAVGIKNLTMNELFFQGHFPDRPIMPGVLMIEAMAQVAGVLLKTSPEHHDHVGLFMAVDNVKFRRTASPGDQLVMEVVVVRDRTRMVSVQAKGRVDDQVVVQADMMFSCLDKKELFG